MSTTGNRSWLGQPQSGCKGPSHRCRRLTSTEPHPADRRRLHVKTDGSANFCNRHFRFGLHDRNSYLGAQSVRQKSCRAGAHHEARSRNVESMPDTSASRRSSDCASQIKVALSIWRLVTLPWSRGRRSGLRSAPTALESADGLLERHHLRDSRSQRVKARVT